MERDKLLKALVKPLGKWTRNRMGDWCAGDYTIMGQRLYHNSDLYKGRGYRSLKAAQAAAEADYRARIAAALDLDKVVALVEAASRYANRYMQDEAADPDLCVPGQHDDAKAVFAALAALGEREVG